MSTKKTKIILNVSFWAESEKSFNLLFRNSKIDTKTEWVPKSICFYSSENRSVEVPEWFYNKKLKDFFNDNTI
jgi:hypothetical protein